MFELSESPKGAAAGSLGESAAEKLSAEAKQKPGRKRGSEQKSSEQTNSEKDVPAEKGPEQQVDSARNESVQAGMEGSFNLPLTKHEFSKNSINIFDRVDADRNGVLSDVELSDAANDPSYEKEDAETVSALFQARRELASLHNEESPVLMMLKFPSNGISKTDLYKFASIENAHSQKMERSSQTKEWLERDGNFLRVDTNADGKLSRQEIETAAVQSAEGSEEYKAMKYLADNYEDVCNRASPLWFLPDVGIEMDDVSTHTREVYTSREGQAIHEVEKALSSSVDKPQPSDEPGVNDESAVGKVDA